MGKFSWVVVVVLALALVGTVMAFAPALAANAAAQGAAVGPIQLAQAPGGGGGMRERRSEMSPAERAKMLDNALDQAGLTAKEKAAAKKAAKSKLDAREALSAELVNLQRAANKSNATDKQLQAALSAYRAAAAKYRKKVAADDAALIKQLSVKGQVKCMSMGILDNGLGRIGGRMGMRGMGGPGGGGGRGRSRGM